MSIGSCVVPFPFPLPAFPFGGVHVLAAAKLSNLRVVLVFAIAPQKWAGGGQPVQVGGRPGRPARSGMFVVS
jgi:hypothetical protein